MHPLSSTSRQEWAAKVSDLPNQVDWVDFAGANDLKLSLQKLLLRLANLEFILNQLSHLKTRFFTVEGVDTHALLKPAVDQTNDTAKVRSGTDSVVCNSVSVNQDDLHRLQRHYFLQPLHGQRR